MEFIRVVLLGMLGGAVPTVPFVLLMLRQNRKAGARG